MVLAKPEGLSNTTPANESLDQRSGLFVFRTVMNLFL